MGKTPAQMVTRGMALKTGVVMAPTMYDQTPEQYMMRWNQGRSRWNSGQCSPLNTIWKCPCSQQPAMSTQVQNSTEATCLEKDERSCHAMATFPLLNLTPTSPARRMTMCPLSNI